MIGPTWGLIDKMGCYVDFAKNKSVILETDQIAQMASCYLTGTYLLKAARPAGYVTIPSENFHWWGIRTLSEREDAGSPQVPVTLSFPSNKFPFSCPTAWLALSFSALALRSGS